MNLEDLGEFGLIDRIRRSSARNLRRAPISIGDDAAALLLSPGTVLLATTDMLLEGVHFDPATTDMASLGWKSAAANLSDIAAMGGTPRFCLVGIGLPAGMTVGMVDAFYQGLQGMLRMHGTMLVGGDTCRSRTGLVISVTLLGEARKGEVLTRSGAQPGDLVWVTGTLGDSAAGLELLKSRGSGHRARGRGEANKLIERHLRPVPRVAWGGKLAASGLVTAMIDVSDGLSSDLGHICDESGYGAEVFEDRLPLSKHLRVQKGLERPLQDYALSGGEDYELLFTAPVEAEDRVRELRVRATVIGAITRRTGMRLVSPSGISRELVPRGYDHFRKARPGRGAAR